ncbi:hypothetical protein [Nocardia sp. XZ_19_385]|uniref:hypothetical protein n=1 Tax=Nocardia sp. XZ_19_385 TaxID=2769488 RepID=UPI00188F51C6|nr:hypothetical protein [Nocardia sp. XZ_19_385]
MSGRGFDGSRDEGAGNTGVGYPQQPVFEYSGAVEQSGQWQQPGVGEPAPQGWAGPDTQWQPTFHNPAPHTTDWGLPMQPPPISPGPRPGASKAWIGIAVAVLVLLGGATAVAVHGESEDPSIADAPGMVSALSTKPSPAAKSKAAEPTAAPNDEKPMVPGYQVVLAPDSGAAYDVPADWTVAAPDVTGKFGAPPNTVMGKGMASEGKDYCPGSTRTVALLTGSDAADTTSAAIELGAKAAQAYSGGANPGPPQPLASYDGTQNGVFVETRGRINNPNPGCAAEYSVYTFATPAEQGNFVMVIAADIGVPKAVDPDTAKRIFASVRPRNT